MTCFRHRLRGGLPGFHLNYTSSGSGAGSGIVGGQTDMGGLICR
ncbi:hypothetical protein [Mycolicibacterium sp.]|nr:hypothetical protein [Mycolicibacterium sp.]